MATHQRRGPTIFISHASTDANLAKAIKGELHRVFAKRLSVFCTSSPGAVAAGADWLSEIERNLEHAQAMIAIVTPISIARPWLWFEVGATWGRAREENCRIFPLCAPSLDISDLPAPLDRLQALSMGKPADLRQLFRILVNRFEFGRLASFDATRLAARLQRYKNADVNPVDRKSYAFNQQPTSPDRQDSAEIPKPKQAARQNRLSEKRRQVWRAWSATHAAKPPHKSGSGPRAPAKASVRTRPLPPKRLDTWRAWSLKRAKQSAADSSRLSGNSSSADRQSTSS